MVRRRFGTVSWGLLAAMAATLAVSCQRASSTQAPSLYVTATGALLSPVTSVQDGQTLVFAPGGGAIQLVIGNTGDAELVLDQVELVHVNSQMDVQPNLAGISFPRRINAGEFQSTEATPLRLSVHFTPGSQPDDSATEIRLHTNDDSYLDGVFTMRFVPQEKVPELTVNPPNYTFLNATATQPDNQDFVLTNTGLAPLALAKVYFESGSKAYRFLGGEPNRDSRIDPVGTGSGKESVTVRVEYTPQNPPDEDNLVIEWDAVRDTGVECSQNATCQNDTKLCGNSQVPCPYSCGNGRCMCLKDSDCQAWAAAEGDSADYRCLTGVCRKPQKTRVRIKGDVKPGQLKVGYGDYLTGCIDFTEVTEPGSSCTKLVDLRAEGPGLVVLTKPQVTVPEGRTSPYSVEWYRLGATQSQECGPVTGTAISEPRFSLTEQNSPVKVAVTYTVTGSNDPNGQLVVSYNAPYAGEEKVPICAGFRKGELETAPPPRAVNVTMFAMPPTGKARKTVVLANRGNDVLHLQGFAVAPQNPGVDPEAFHLIDPPTGAALDLPPNGLLSLTVEFDGTVYEVTEETGVIVLNGFLHIDYQDPFSTGTLRETVNLIGWTNVKDVTLPTANPGTPADHAGATVGKTEILDGGASVGGTYEIPPQGGYLWFMDRKPTTSKVFVNPGPGPAQVSFIPDVPGTYGFRLVVFSYDSDSRLAFFSDEATLEITVAP